jgi:hypothetical protein
VMEAYQVMDAQVKKIDWQVKTVWLTGKNSLINR